MAAATSGEPASLDTFADVCCTLMLACERAGDAERPQQWSRVLEEFVRRYDHVTLLAFCRFRIADGKFAGYWCLTNVAGLMRQITEEQAVESTPATV